ncbi:sensor histidine kinase [Kovacikia minuta CCNUW1]|uniref:sensor histidine kinase n=1 Tax=Kovacikia minuta TaxID=2931930 RepID=UPI001CCCEC58|nr:sensor histidine kinase [Kovacikia minuta]UBF26602.1 sensor histidine kinase [Kovacikia minuta CCNUW1]
MESDWEHFAENLHLLRTPLNGLLGYLRLLLDEVVENSEEQHEFLQEAYRFAIHLLNTANDLPDLSRHKIGNSQLEPGQEPFARAPHALKTTLTGMSRCISDCLNLVLNKTTTTLEEEEREFLLEAYHSGLHLLGIISDSLDFLNRTKNFPSPQPVRLSQLLNDVSQFAHPLANQKHLYFEIQAPPAIEIVVLGYYRSLKQIMCNLVGNAIKFTPVGGVTIRVEVIRDKILFQNQELPGIAYFQIMETRFGFPLENQGESNPYSPDSGGLVEATKGMINFFHDESGLGSEVSFTVPLYSIS